MIVLSQQRCRNHPDREAVLRCGECRNFFCRECGTEHDGRMLCASCIQSLVKAESKATRAPWGLTALLLSAANFLLIWVLFYICARVLAAVPSSFHEGTFWR